MPIRYAARVRSTSPRSTPRPAAIDGKAGRYMSMEKGPMAVSAPMRMSQPGMLREMVCGGMGGAVRGDGVQGRASVIAWSEASRPLYHGQACV
ncbi:Uncharacterised protein [Bordetella pertussis]|nr:Uncharacterised protein [Bordetella pertussis]